MERTGGNGDLSPLSSRGDNGTLGGEAQTGGSHAFNVFFANVTAASDKTWDKLHLRSKDSYLIGIAETHFTKERLLQWRRRAKVAKLNLQASTPQVVADPTTGTTSIRGGAASLHHHVKKILPLKAIGVPRELVAGEKAKTG